jgi:TetR/AcrR family transcriptional regulator, transcriptional repressor for nem operon
MIFLQSSSIHLKKDWHNMGQLSRDILIDAAYNQYWLKGYSGTSVDAILREAQLPKGSFYHFFKSKKAIAIATIHERIVPKMKIFFSPHENDDPIDGLMLAIKNIATVDALLALGCPLNKLIRELLPQNDAELNNALINGYQEIHSLVAKQLKKGIDPGKLQGKNINMYADFVLSTTWGALSLGEKPVNKEHFLASMDLLHEYLNFLRIKKKV